MKVTVEKVDDINFIMSGTVDNSVIEDKVAKLKEEAKVIALLAGSESPKLQELAEVINVSAERYHQEFEELFKATEKSGLTAGTPQNQRHQNF